MAACRFSIRPGCMRKRPRCMPLPMRRSARQAARAFPLREDRPMEIDRIDHVVMTVRDIEATCDFYTRVLGMRVVTFAGGRKALAFGRQKINLHLAGREF